MLDVRLAAPQRLDRLTIHPLVTADAAELPYTLLLDAIAAGTLRVTEVGSGSVPSLEATNTGQHDVLVVDGEQLIGAKQNRMVGRSMLLPAGRATHIPVSCIEQGRWSFRSEAFDSAPQHSPARVRRRVRDLEAARVAHGAAADPDSLAQAQSDVWGEVRAMSDDLAAHSPTAALDEVHALNRSEVDRIAAAFRPIDGQVGLLAFAGDTPLGLDVIGGRALYAKLHDRLLRGYVLDAIARRVVGPRVMGGAESGADGVHDAGAGRGAPDDAAERAGVAPAQAFLDAARQSRRTSAPTVGRGEYHVLTGATVGGELVADDALVHLAAFPAEQTGGGAGWGEETAGRPPIPGPSRRRRR